MDVNALLNPVSEEDFASCDSPSPSPSARLRSSSSPAPPPKRQRMAKDAAIFTKSQAKGQVSYPPHESRPGTELYQQHKKYQLYPLGHIAEYCRHIPYNSEKKSFLAKTGRESFEGMQIRNCDPNLT